MRKIRYRSVNERSNGSIREDRLNRHKVQDTFVAAAAAACAWLSPTAQWPFADGSCYHVDGGNKTLVGTGWLSFTRLKYCMLCASAAKEFSRCHLDASKRACPLTWMSIDRPRFAYDSLAPLPKHPGQPSEVGEGWWMKPPERQNNTTTIATAWTTTTTSPANGSHWWTSAPPMSNHLSPRHHQQQQWHSRPLEREVAPVITLLWEWCKFVSKYQQWDITDAGIVWFEAMSLKTTLSYFASSYAVLLLFCWILRLRYYRTNCKTS